MKNKELKVKNEKQLIDLLAELRNKFMEMRFKVAQRQLKKVHEIKTVKRDIARILTILEQKKADDKEKK